MVTIPNVWPPHQRMIARPEKGAQGVCEPTSGFMLTHVGRVYNSKYTANYPFRIIT